MFEAVLIVLAVLGFLVALCGVGLVIGPARSDRWAAKLLGRAPNEEPVTGYSDPGLRQGRVSQ